MTDHRQLAVDFFNHTWTLLDEQNRTPEQDKEMVHVAHASRYHWSIAGTVKNHARGDWQLARVYAAVGRFDESERYATYYLEACEENGFDDWDLPFAYEGLARACVQTNKHKSLEFLNEARKQGELIAKDDDKQWLMTNLDEIAAMLDGE
ncbi:MAG: hypothetical protein QGI78_09150 [Phycisphaerales bacterium]|nr:hypothetical protein [Phycisphaerales bacterium]